MARFFLSQEQAEIIDIPSETFPQLSESVDSKLREVGQTADAIVAVDKVSMNLTDDLSGDDAAKVVLAAESLINILKVDVVFPSKRSFTTESHKAKSIRFSRESITEAIGRGFKKIMDIIKKIIEAIGKFFKAIWYVLTGEKGKSDDLEKSDKEIKKDEEKIKGEAEEVKKKIEEAKKAQAQPPVTVPSPPPTTPQTQSVTPPNTATPPAAQKTPDEIKAESIDKLSKEIQAAIANYANGFMDRLKNHAIVLHDDNMKYVESTYDNINPIFGRVVGIANNIRNLTEEVNKEAMSEVHKWINSLDDNAVESGNIEKTLEDYTNKIITSLRRNNFADQKSDGTYFKNIMKGYSGSFLSITFGVENKVKLVAQHIDIRSVKESILPNDAKIQIPSGKKTHNPTDIKPGYDKSITILRGMESSQFKIKKEWEKFLDTMEGLSANFSKNNIKPENQIRIREAIMIILNNYRVVTDIIKKSVHFLVTDFDQLKDFYKDILCIRYNKCIHLMDALETVRSA